MAQLNTNPTRRTLNPRQIIVLTAGVLAVLALIAPWWSDPQVWASYSENASAREFRRLLGGQLTGYALVATGTFIWVAASLAVRRWAHPTGFLARITDPKHWATLVVVGAVSYIPGVLSLSDKHVGFWFGLLAALALTVTVVTNPIPALAAHALLEPAAAEFAPYWAKVATPQPVYDMDGNPAGSLYAGEWYLVVADHAGEAVSIRMPDESTAVLHDLTDLTPAA